MKMKKQEMAAIQGKIQYHQSCITYWHGILISGPRKRDFMQSGTNPDINELNSMSEENAKQHCIEIMHKHLLSINSLVNKLETFGLPHSVYA